MPERKSAGEVLSVLVGVVRRIERDAAELAIRAGGVAAVLDKIAAATPEPHKVQPPG